jgi:putative membrane protein (TIGR04086 family)
MEIQNEQLTGRSILSLLKTTLFAFVVTGVLLGVLALLICFTPLPEEAVTPSVYALNYFSVFLAGLFSAAKGKRRGFLTGAAAGGIYMVCLYLLGYILFGGISFTKGVLLQIVYCVAVGTVGGIVGINLSRR